MMGQPAGLGVNPYSPPRSHPAARLCLNENMLAQHQAQDPGVAHLRSRTRHTLLSAGVPDPLQFHQLVNAGGGKA